MSAYSDMKNLAPNRKDLPVLRKAASKLVSDVYRQNIESNEQLQYNQETSKNEGKMSRAWFQTLINIVTCYMYRGCSKELICWRTPGQPAT